MFQNQRYITRGIESEIPIELQLFMWRCIESVPKPDYLQIFRLDQEEPEYRKEYLLKSSDPITAKVYVIDSDTYSTMLLANEY